MPGHVVDDLSAYAEDQLPAGRRAAVEAHLGGCTDCREELARVERGLHLVASLAVEGMPAGRAGVVREALVRTPAAPLRRARPWRRLGQAAAVVFLVGGGAAAYWQVNRPWIRLERADAVVSPFEAAGRRLHERLAGGDETLDLFSADAGTLWAWLERQGAPVPVPVLTGADPTRFVPVGAAVRSLAGARVSVLAFRVDGRPVTLALANRDAVTDRPPAGWWSKRVRHRLTAAGHHDLTWTIGQGTYVMVSELDGDGLRACLVCHDDPRFVRRVSGPGGLGR